MADPKIDKKNTVSHLIANIGNYTPYTKPGDKPVDYKGQETALKVELTEVNKSHLYNGIVEYQESHTQQIQDFEEKYAKEIQEFEKKYGKPKSGPNYFREFFLKYVNKVIDEKPRVEQKIKKPKDAAIKLNALFDELGAKLFDLALKEEVNSEEYMNALCIKSTKEYPGKKWAERPIVLVAGPSASGKTHAANATILEASKFLKTKDEKTKDETTADALVKDKAKNQAVFIDGGIIREVSQVRKLASKVATNKGYSGVKDLYKQSKDILNEAKDRMYEYALSTEHGLVIPETFSSSGIKIKLHDDHKAMIQELSDVPDSKLIFARVKGKDPSTFQNVVFHMGNSRSWKTCDFELEEYLDLNQDNKTESKAYDEYAFRIGKRGSKLVENYYKKVCKSNLNMIITNDLVLKKPDLKNPKKWIDAAPLEKGAILVSERLYNQWLTNSVDKDGHFQNLDEYNRKNWQSLPALIQTSDEIKIKSIQSKIKKHIQIFSRRISKSESLKARRDEKCEILKSVDKALSDANLRNKDSVAKAIITISKYLSLMESKNYKVKTDVKDLVKELNALHKGLIVENDATYEEEDFESPFSLSVEAKSKPKTKPKPETESEAEIEHPELVENEENKFVDEHRNEKILRSLEKISQTLKDNPGVVEQTATGELFQVYHFAKQCIDDKAQEKEQSFKELREVIHEKCKDTKSQATSSIGGTKKAIGMGKQTTIERFNTSTTQKTNFSYKLEKNEHTKKFRWSDSDYAVWAKGEIDTLIAQYYLSREREVKKSGGSMDDAFKLVINGNVPRVIVQAWVTYCHVLGVEYEFGVDGKNNKIEPYTPTPQAIDQFKEHLKLGAGPLTETTLKSESRLSAKKVTPLAKETLAKAINKVINLAAPVENNEDTVVERATERRRFSVS